MIILPIKKLSFFILLLAFVQLAQAQVKIGDNPTVINKGSILELESANKGLLFPRVNLINTTTWSLAASSTPVAGMMVYNIKTIAAGFSGTTPYPAIAGDGTGIYYWDGGGWVAAKGANGTSGNSLYTGLTIPPTTTGKDGDTYIDTVTGNVYTKIGGVWTNTGNIKFSETITTLTQGTGANAGIYTHKNEAGALVDIKVTQTGTGAPTGPGKAGDVYVDNSTGSIYAYNAATNTWVQSNATTNALALAGASLTSKVNGVTSNVIDLAPAIKANETLTTLSQGTGANAGIYTYTSENGTKTAIKVTQTGVGAPTGPGKAGDVYVDSATGDIYTYNGTSWVLQKPSSGPGAPTIPGTPGNIYVDSTTGDVYTYNSTTNSWQKSNEVTLMDGINTKATKIAGSNTTYKIDVATAVGTTLGVVKQAATSPTVTINASGELAVDLTNLNRVITTAVTYTALPNDNVILANATANDVTITLPVAAGQMGKRYIIKKFDTNEDFYVRVMGVAVGDIDGLTIPSKGLSTGLPFAGWELVSDGSKWQIINKF